MFTILTHPPTCNYGGILQALAMQNAAITAGVSCKVLEYEANDRLTRRCNRSMGVRVKDLISFMGSRIGIFRKCIPAAYIHLFFSPFKRKFMHLQHLNGNRAQLSELMNDTSFIVGSDQVWRGEYARLIESLPFFFLNFATQSQRRRSIAYAASFGSDEWEGTPEETAECARLLRDFKVVSVREHSGIRICRDVFGVKAVQMPDPTLLLEQEDYNRLIRRWRTKSTKTPFMAVYLLDETAEKTELVQALSQCTGLYPQHLMPHPGAEKLMDRLPLSIPQWLRFIRDSENVLTDSFHGCVFSIIFNKPFVCMGNANRGSARFDSLLGTFGLQDRLVTNPSPGKIQKLINTPIDWERVNTIRHHEQQRAFDFLHANLK